MYAVVQIGGHQYRVAEGDVIFVDKQSDEADQKLTFDRVLLISDGDGGVTVGKPVIEGAAVEAKLLENVKSDKVIVFKKKRRKGYRVKRGHRQQMSRIEIEKITSSGKKAARKTEEKQKVEAAEKPKAKAKKEEAGKVSTDMLAKEAIDHINDTPLDQLEGFVPEDEDRVTVLDAWESKQHEKEEPGKRSTDMLAKEAIDHISNTPLDQLEGFVPEDEDRVTVLDAWESKQKEEE